MLRKEKPKKRKSSKETKHQPITRHCNDTSGDDLVSGALMGAAIGLIYMPVSMLGALGFQYLEYCIPKIVESCKQTVSDNVCERVVGGGLAAISTIGFIPLAANCYIDDLMCATLTALGVPDVGKNGAINLLVKTGIASAAIGAGYTMFRSYKDRNRGVDDNVEDGLSMQLRGGV